MSSSIGRNLRTAAFLSLTVAARVPAQQPIAPPGTGPFAGAGFQWQKVDTHVVYGEALPRTQGTASAATVVHDGSVQPAGVVRLVRTDHGTLRWLEGRLGQIATPPKVVGTGTSPDLGSQITGLLTPYTYLLGLTNLASELRLQSASTDDSGARHVRFDQVYNGIPVWGSDLYVHISSDNVIRILNGEYVRTPSGVDTVPTVPALAASRTVQSDFESQGRWHPTTDARFEGDSTAAPDLVIYNGPKGPVLAWAASVRPNLLEWWTVFVDAHNGAIIHRIPQFCNAGFANATAADLNGVTQSFRVWQNDTGTSYLFWDLPNYDPATSTLPDTMTGGIQTLDLRGHDAVQASTIFYITSANNTWPDPAAVSAHYDALIAYNYYHDTFGRKAIDGKDTTIESVVHVTENGAPMDNAYWNGKAMFYGDGNTIFKPLAGSLDVAGHEMTHGVTQNTADLVYENQSGALNESISDTFGVMVDPSNLLIGETIMKPGMGIALRDLEHPDNPNVFSPQPATMAQYVTTTDDNGGVHTNSGIPNRAAALIIDAIGRDKAQRIYYRALTTYFTRSSQFADDRIAVEQSAKDLYGTTEVAAVDSAFDAVGIKAAIVTVPGSGTVPPVSGGTPVVAFIENDGTIGLLDPPTGNFSTFSSPSAKVRADIPNDDRAQVSTPLDGSALYFINQTGHLSFIKTDTNQILTYPGVHITTDGDLWNACISPDGNYVTLVSSNRTDRSLYILDLRRGFLGHIILDLQASDGGATDTSILFADVTSWSPNMGVPKIGFDALHQVNINGVDTQYYGMGEINFSTNRIYDLVPGQTPDISVGNITYSNTNPDNIAYNTFTTVGTSTFVDIVLSNNGNDVAQNMGSYQVNSQSIADALRPTFSPDDTQFCFTSPALNLVGFLNPDTKALGGWILPFSPYNPRWFVKGGIAPYTFADVRLALELARGGLTASTADLARLNLVDTGTSQGKVTIADAVRIARKVTGVSP